MPYKIFVGMDSAVLLQTLVSLVLRNLKFYGGQHIYTHVWQCLLEKISRGTTLALSVWLLVSIFSNPANEAPCGNVATMLPFGRKKMATL